MANNKFPTSYATIPWKHILVSFHPPSPDVNKVAVITINRPEKYNAFTVEIETEMIRALDMFDEDDRVRVVVVTGAGRMFCAGADLDVGLHREEGGKTKGHRDG
jgi:enoyl-CoA hydratase/carnithine racemase